MYCTNTTKRGTPIITLPGSLSFRHKGVIDFNPLLSIFDWRIMSDKLIINGEHCKSANETIRTIVDFVFDTYTN